MGCEEDGTAQAAMQDALSWPLPREIWYRTLCSGRRAEDGGPVDSGIAGELGSDQQEQQLGRRLSYLIMAGGGGARLSICSKAAAALCMSLPPEPRIIEM